MDYNSNAAILNELKKICRMIERARSSFLEFFEKTGKVDLRTNFDFTTGQCQKKSKIVEIKNAADLERYFRYDLQCSIDDCLRKVPPDGVDYLVYLVIDHIMTSDGKYPDDEQMAKLQQEAETKRKANMPP